MHLRDVTMMVLCVCGVLRNNMRPDIEQGKLQMWVDIFPSHCGSPQPPVNISPRQPREYELRIVVWDTKDIIPMDVR